MKQPLKPEAFNLPRLAGLPFAPGIALLYLLTSGLWIYYSDLAADWLTETPEQMRLLSTYKGMFFVAATTLLLLILVRQFVLKATLMQKDLQKREEQYRELVENQTDLIVKTDPAGRFLFANRPYCDLIGQAEEKLPGTAFTAFAHENDLQPLLKPPHSSRLEQRIWIENDWHWLAWHHNAVLDHSGKVTAILSIGRDITDRKQASDALRSSEENLRITLNSIGDAVISTDTAGRVTIMNPIAEQLTGWTLSEARNRPLTEIFNIINEQTRNPVGNPYANVLATGAIVGLANHTLLISKDGRETPIADSGAPICDATGKMSGVVLVFRDQSEERAARQTIEASETRYRLLFENMTTGFALHEMIYDEQRNPVDYRWLQINPAFEKLTGLTAAKALGHTAREILPELESFWIETFGKVAKTGEPVDFENYSKDLGKYFEVRAFCPAPDQFAVVFTDVTERTTARQNLEESRQFLRTVIDSLPVRVFWKDRNSTYLGVNRPFAQDSGVETPEELVGKTDFDMSWTNDEANAFRADDRAVIESGTSKLNFEEPQTRPGGAVCWLKTSKAPLKNIRGEIIGVIGVYEDITEYKAVHQKLEESRQLLREVLDTMPDRVWWKDPRSAFLGCNLNFARDAGHDSPDELIGKTDYDLCWKDQADHFVADDREVLNSGRPKLKIQEFQTQPDGQIRWIETNKIPLRDLTGQVIGTLGTYTDITEEKKNKAEMQRLSMVVEQSPDAVVITTPEGTIQYVNPAFENITGYSRQEAIGQNPRMLKSGRQSPSFYTDLWETIASGKTWDGHFVNKRKNGDLYTEKATISPVREPSGAISGYVAVKRDITQELIRDEQFRQRQKMEAIGQLAGGVSHDFNNILQAILGFSELLLIRLSRQSEEYGHVQEIRTAALRAADLTRQLLTFSRKQTIQLTAVDLNLTIRNMDVLLTVLLGEKTKLQFNLADHLQPVHADAGQMTQVIMNLAVNARDAMPENGQLTITTENVTLAEQDLAALPEVEPGDFVCLSVTDTGCGMSKEIKDRLFEPFFTTKELDKGTGLGLSVVYGIIKQCKGGLTVYSQEGQGTSFKIYLPSGPAAMNE